MSARQEVIAALRTRLATVPNFNLWPLVVYANREPNTRPSAGEQHLEETVFASSSTDASVGINPRWRETVGTWQIALCILPDSDVIAALTFADALEKTFTTSIITLADGVTAVRITNVLVGAPRPARPDDAWIRIPVVFTYTVTSKL